MTNTVMCNLSESEVGFTHKVPCKKSSTTIETLESKNWTNQVFATKLRNGFSKEVKD